MGNVEGAVLPIKRTTEEFVSDANKVHDGRYDYLLVEYVNNKTKVVVICPDHGEFFISPSNHLSGKGCGICGRERQWRSATKSFADFEAEARAIHGDEYRYDKHTYRNARTKMRMVCSVHGEFMQTPMAHLHGNGCKKCGYEKTADARRLTQNSFDRLLSKKYGGRIQASYFGMYEAIIAHCAKHGDFNTTAHALLYTKHGCAKCAHDAKTGGSTLSNEEILGLRAELANLAKEFIWDIFDTHAVIQLTTACMCAGEDGSPAGSAPDPALGHIIYDYPGARQHPSTVAFTGSMIPSYPFT